MGAMAIIGCHTKPMKKLPLLIASCLALTGVLHAEDSKTEADNTAKNERDRVENKETPFDQSEKAEDVELTASIRKEVIADDSLSALAKNAKIITNEGKVVLRGPVETKDEKAKIAALAKEAGAKSVTNELEVK